MKFKPILFLAIAFGLYFVSGAVELRGDVAPVEADGVSAERATYHIMALVLLLAAIGFFIAALVGFVSRMRG